MNKVFATTSALGLVAALCSCGHSEEEWQAQLGRYRAEIARADARQKEANQARDELRESRTRVAELEQQLTSMGVSLESKDRAVDQLTDNLADVRRALEAAKARARTLELIRARMSALRVKLEELTKIGLKVSIRKNRMVISLPGDVLFDTGKTDLKPDGKAVLLKVAETIRNDPGLVTRDFQVAGHTDSKPLTGPPFQDNWGLSVMRARQVVVFLTAPQQPVAARGQRPPEPGAGLPPQRWSAAGHGDTDPIAPNDSPDGMLRNRRVELIVMPNLEEMLDLRELVTPSNF